MAIMTREKFDEVLENCLAKYCDRKISDTTENIDPDGYNKARTVIWYYKPYTFKAGYLFGGNKEFPNFVPLCLTARLDGDTEEEKLKTGDDLAEKILKVNFMRKAGIV